jgi:Rnl2 family RNA ligase
VRAISNTRNLHFFPLLRDCYSSTRTTHQQSQINMWNFTSYEKIAESSNRWQLDEAGERSLEKTPWVVTEKIHGANFCFVTDGEVIRCANRKQLLEPGDNFFNYQKLLERLNSHIQQAFKIAHSKYSYINRLFIYGELFGGKYPHPDIAPDISVQAVQTGIYYSPTVEFCAFDMALEGKNDVSSRTYLDWDKAIEILREAGIFYAEPLFIGKYNEAIAFSIGFTSTIPQRLNLPPLEEANKAEGIVVKPLKPIYIDTPKGKIRPILKVKIPDFSEDKRYSLAEKWTEAQAPTQQDGLEILKWEAFNLITENRLKNAISKVGYGELGEKSKSSQIYKLMVEDVIEEITENQNQLMLDTSEGDKKRLLDFVSAEVRKILKKYFHK